MSAPCHEIQERVYYADTDAGNVVYYANYLRYAEHGRTEFLRAAGLNLPQLVEEYGILFVVVRCEIDYRASARLDDLLTIRTSLAEIGNASLAMDQSILCGETLCADMRISLVCLNDKGRPTRIPDVVRDAMTNLDTK